MAVNRELLIVMVHSVGELRLEVDWDDAGGATVETGKLVQFIATNTTGIVGKLFIRKPVGNPIWKEISIPDGTFTVSAAGPIKNMDDINGWGMRLPE